MKLPPQVTSVLRDALRTGKLLSSRRPRNKITITIPRIDVPTFVFGWGSMPKKEPYKKVNWLIEGF